MRESEVYEKIGQLKAAIDAAHCRMDDVQKNIAGLLEDVKASLARIETDFGPRVLALEAHANQDKGAKAAARWLIGTLLVIVGILCGILAGKS